MLAVANAATPASASSPTSEPSSTSTPDPKVDELQSALHGLNDEIDGLKAAVAAGDMPSPSATETTEATETYEGLDLGLVLGAEPGARAGLLAERHLLEPRLVRARERARERARDPTPTCHESDSEDHHDGEHADD